MNPSPALPVEFRPRIPQAYDDKHTRHFLIPGNVFVAAQPFVITTIVGSGVVLCLWDSAHHVGGANHFTLPEGSDDVQNPTRYGNIANPALLQRLLDLGAELKTIHAKVFGGSLPIVTVGRNQGHLGDHNVQAVSLFLHENAIHVAQRGVGGARGRKVVFQTDDGHSWTEPL